MSKAISRPPPSKPSKQKLSQASSTWRAIVQQGARNGLSRERIVAAGIRLADKHGLAAVSIRRIAAELGSSPMALYHYVPSKRDLQNLMLDTYSAEFEWPPRRFSDWRGALGHYARESRRCLKRHPWASALRATDPEYGPECIRNLEILLSTLSDFGLEMRAATRALGVLFVFVNGFVTIETGDAAIHVSEHGRPVHQPRFSSTVLETGKFPHVTHFVAMGAELPDDEGFDRSLKWILDGMEADINSQLQSQRRKERRSATR